MAAINRIRREFSSKFCGRELQELLNNRKKKRSDEMRLAAYCYTMKKLSMQGDSDIDEQSLLECIFDGIQGIY